MGVVYYVDDRRFFPSYEDHERYGLLLLNRDSFSDIYFCSIMKGSETVCKNLHSRLHSAVKQVCT